MISNLNAGLGLPAAAARAARAARARLEIRRRGDVALVLQLLDDLLDQLVEPRLGVLAVLPVLAEQLLERLVREQAAVQQRLQDGVVQRLHRVAVLVVSACRRDRRTRSTAACPRGATAALRDRGRRDPRR